MAPRNTARSSAARNQASSPPKATRQSQSPIGRRTRTRSSRSRSLDPELVDATMKKQRGGRRTDRETSVSSVGSAASASSRGSRSRKHTRKPAVNRDLSMVAEDIEDTEARGFAPSDEEDEEDDAIENIEIEIPGPRSPAMSQMSGTTAMTSYSAQEIAKLDPMMADFLPELLDSASKVLHQLAPKNAIETEDQVRSIVKDLKIPGSRRGKLLHLHEQRFTTAKKYYGSNTYIEPTFILRKLLGTPNPEDGNFRPDPVIYSANLATLVTEFLVLQRGEAKTKSTLEVVCLKDFPLSFTGKPDLARRGQEYEDEVFELALDFHTQYAMVCLALVEQDEDQLSPDQVLASVFYDQYDHTVPEASFAEMVDGGVLKDILRSGKPYRKTQVKMIQKRLGSIIGTFRNSEEAREAGDLVDFDQLYELFPWTTFITSLVQWSRSRFDDMSEAISQRGGVDEIAQSLVELVKSSDSQDSLQNNPPPAAIKKRELLPAPDIEQSNPSFHSESSVRTLMKMRTGKSGNPSSNPHPARPHASSPRPQVRSKQAASAPIPVSAQPDPDPTQEAEDEDQPMIDDDNDDVEERPRPISEYAAAWNENSKEKNKENHKPTVKAAAKPRLIDRQPNAQKVVWDESQDDTVEPSPTKRTRAETEETDESEDQGFQEDQRPVDPNRRAIAPPGPRFSPSEASPPPPKKRRRSQIEVSPRVESSRAATQRSSERSEPERARRQQVEESDSDSEVDHPAPTASEIGNVARIAVAKAKGVQVPKGRTPWSERDSRILRRGIERHGCAWATIFNLGNWDHTRDQVALKDRARNMKVNMLKSGIPLPLNFDLVSLGKKEIDKVRITIPDYEE
ncbi:hypothetical protein VTL71DRAFT_3308 [Oculimacula yallundae]|uniref:Myb-like domain-containing protein n=1 Tax=Oculimacula yallundae TaxID=86028 RepID=A0ABR4C6T9_9HELO